MNRPACWELAMEVLGDPEAGEIAGYVAQLESALLAAEDSLESLRRGHGVEVSSLCYPAANLVREALGH